MSSCASLGGPVPLPPPGPSAALPPGAPARALHVELPSQQRRLRHLRNIAARNIVNRNGHQLLDTYFTLHLCDNEKIYKEFYRSEVIKNSLTVWLNTFPSVDCRSDVLTVVEYSGGTSQLMPNEE
ncbi:UV radiation resistance-associated protein [Cricetulus griseus]|nr:UV radiation resistance-associated protein [Cricetulus griseus]